MEKDSIIHVILTGGVAGYGRSRKSQPSNILIFLMGSLCSK
jgi:hypothetical protein